MPRKKTPCLECGKPSDARSDRCQQCYQNNAVVRAQSRGQTSTTIRRVHKSHGYVQVRRRGKWEYEHRVIMESVLGRPLREGENVHHKNSDRSDNRPENLELWLSKGNQPKGARVEDLVEWAHEIIRIYG